MFLNEQDEYCIRSRGTNVFKSPEMLANDQVRIESDNYDRRKKQGTTRASDIWSIGCLFYELLTGKLLFPEIDEDYCGFTIVVNHTPFSEIFTLKKREELNNNTYLIDLLKFFMVCDQKYRPNIDRIIERYDHVHAILVNSNTCNNPSFNINLMNNLNLKNSIIQKIENSCNHYNRNNDLNLNNIYQLNSNLFLNAIDSSNNPTAYNFEYALETMQEMYNSLINNYYQEINKINVKINHQNSILENYQNNQNASINKNVITENENINWKIQNKDNNFLNKNKNYINVPNLQIEDCIKNNNKDFFHSDNNNCNNIKNSYLIQKKINIKLNYIPSIFKITQDIFICDYNNFESEFQNTPNRLSFLGITHYISWKKPNCKRIVEKTEFLNLMETTTDLKKPIFYHIFKVLDFLRYCMIHQGIVCFLDDFQYSNIQEKPNFFIRNLIILCFSYMMKLPAYDAWTYINSKLLFFHFPTEDLINLSIWINNQMTIEFCLASYPSFRCLCGGCVIYLRNHLISNNFKIIPCSCSEKYENFDNSKCPSNGCYDYIQDLKVNIN